MRHASPTRSIANVVVIAALALATNGFGPSELVERYTAEESALVAFGLERFQAHGLTLPDLRIEFLHDIRHCYGHLGLYYESELRLRMCSLDKKTMLHELAHAWTNLNLSDDEKAAFSSSRDVNWNDTSDPWRDRGTEHAAEIVAWALSDERYSVRWTSIEGGVSVSDFRLLTIGNGTVEELHLGFVMLTGIEPEFRSSIELSSLLLESEWQQTTGQSTSPEAD